MIYGDPFIFAFQFDVVESWNTPGDIWRNGMFSLYIEGNKLFDVVDVFELTTTFSFYSKATITDLSVNDLSIDAIALYKNARNYFIGDGEVLIDGLFDLTCTAMGDNGCYLYFLKTSNGDRLVWSTDCGRKVKEAILPRGTVHSVINQLREFS
ncbi:immunity 42 family protein [Citrobacter enshiensis]|uniref:immunity 42 family protein n=1 Tax=Citrobacter enshiensis TaxID=2971264 RepID=UPI0023E820FE|nr:immunity 42 family protein [Citrobacter enshiensis]WET39805.1 immunity 42 family protein [Citrobacter enshiensis]